MYMEHKDYTKEAEQNVLNRAQDMKMAVELLRSFTSKYMTVMDTQHQKAFFEAMDEAVKVVQSAYADNIVNLFIFTGIGGSEALEYARQQLKERFRPEEDSVKMEIMSLLSRNGEVSWYRNEIRDEFNRQMLDKIYGDENGD